MCKRSSRSSQSASKGGHFGCSVQEHSHDELTLCFFSLGRHSHFLDPPCLQIFKERGPPQAVSSFNNESRKLGCG